MSAWTDAMDKANNSLFAKLGEDIVYSRPGNSTLDPVAAFAAMCVPDTTIAANSNKGSENVVYVRISEIPGDPQKGDQMVWRERNWQVQEILAKSDGLARLGIRDRGAQ